MHPAALVGKAGLERTRIQVYDAPLTTAPTDAITIHHGGVANAYGSQPAVSVFDDRGDYTRPYLDDGHSDGGAILPAGGTVVRLKSIDGARFAQVSVEAAK